MRLIWLIRRPRRLAGTLAPLLVGAALWAALSPARAQVPTEGPVFSAPTEITNSFFPVSPGAVKVYIGREDGQKITIVETHRPETRVFEWEGAFVECRIVDRLTFLAGRPIELERRFFAQADDGTVYCLGEVEKDEDEAGDVDDKDDPDEKDGNGWVVGQVAADDPPDVLTGGRPMVRMPAAPEVGDEWALEDFPPAYDERCEVRQAMEAVRVPAGHYTGCLRIRKESESDGDREANWHAPGIGLVKIAGDGIKLRLQASTLRPE